MERKEEGIRENLRKEHWSCKVHARRKRKKGDWREDVNCLELKSWVALLSRCWWYWCLVDNISLCSSSAFRLLFYCYMGLYQIEKSKGGKKKNSVVWVIYFFLLLFKPFFSYRLLKEEVRLDYVGFDKVYYISVASWVPLGNHLPKLCGNPGFRTHPMHNCLCRGNTIDPQTLF